MRIIPKSGVQGSNAALLVLGGSLAVLMTLLYGCTPVLEALPAGSSEGGVCNSATILRGRVTTGLTGPSTRPFVPKLQFFELVNTTLGHRVRINVESDDTSFVLPLPPGDYQLTRVGISEGAFQALAEIGAGFMLSEGTMTDIGTWHLSIESPQYDREIVFSSSSEPKDHIKSTMGAYPCLGARSVVSTSVYPAAVETRLYETAPYPRIWWFRRHHTT